MNYKLFLLLASISVIPSTFGSDKLSAQQLVDKYGKNYSPDARSKILQGQKEKQEADAQKRLDKRAKGREIQKHADVVIGATNEVSEILTKLPLSIQQQNPTTAIAIINHVVRGVSIGIRAIGRRKEALQAVLSTNEQILEAAIQSYEKIEAMTKTIEELLGQKTIISALKDTQSSDLSKSQKILGLLSPSNYLNTFNKITDDLYITTNKAERWEKIKAVSKALKEEQARFDDYMALLEIKALEKEMMRLHKIENFNAVKNPVTGQESIKGYNSVLKKSIKTLDAAIAITDDKIKDLKIKTASKGGVLNHLKKVIGKDAETQNAKAIVKLMDEREKYVKQREDVERQIQDYQEMDITPQQIAEERALIKQQIEDIQIRRAPKTSPEELGNEVITLKNQIQSLQKDVEALKIRAGQMLPVPASKKRS